MDKEDRQEVTGLMTPQTVPLKLLPTTKKSTVPDKVESTILSPESPPEYEKGLTSLDYVPKSPVYHTAGYSDGESDKDSLIDLGDENWDGRQLNSKSQESNST